jgi:hypothetical protein
MRPIQVSIVGPDAQRLKEIGAEVGARWPGSRA